MDEPVPRKVVKVTRLTGNQKTRWDGISVGCLFGPIRALASLVYETRPLDPESILQFEQTRFDGREKSAFHTSEPAGKRPHLDTDQRLGRGVVFHLVLVDRRHAQGLDLRTQHPSDVCQKACFMKGTTPGLIPLLGGHRDD
jgi:hypothetical protein